MKKGCKIALVGGLAAVVGIAACWKWMIRMPLGEFTRYALYMAVLDDEICRNELEGNQIGDQVITFAPRVETLQERYHLFLELNRTKDRRPGAAAPGVPAVCGPTKGTSGGGVCRPGQPLKAGFRGDPGTAFASLYQR